MADDIIKIYVTESHDDVQITVTSIEPDVVTVDITEAEQESVNIVVTEPPIENIVVRMGEGELVGTAKELMDTHEASTAAHPLSSITEDSTHRSVTDTEKSTWNGKQDSLTFGIADTDKVKIDAADVADNDYARFTANGLEGRSTSEVLSDIGAISSSLIGANNGVAQLDNTGKIPSNQLPSYVDDVLEFDTITAFPVTGESNKIYIAIDTNNSYRWGGSSYVSISSGGVALGETELTAYRGDRGKTAYDHSQITGNPHGITASTVGLGNVDNTSDANKPISSATSIALGGKVDNVTGKGLSEADFTSDEKQKLSGITAGAEPNVNADWNASNGDAQILNKPSIPTSLSSLSDDSTHRLVTDTEKSTWNGKQDALVFGIADTNKVRIDGVGVETSDFAKFTEFGLVGRSGSEVLSDIGAVSTNDSRLSDARTPTSHGNDKHSSTFITAADVPTALSALSDDSTHRLVTDTEKSTWNGKQNALTFGISNNSPVKIDASDVADNDYAKFTENGIEGRSYSEVLSDIGAVASNDSRLSDARTPTSHGNEAHSSTFVVSNDSRLSDARTPTSHGNEAHSSTFVLTGDSRLSDARTPTSHGNEAHSSTFVLTGDSRLSDARTPTSHGDEAHSSTYIKDGDSRLTDSRTPTSHGNEAHSSTFITSSDVPTALSAFSDDSTHRLVTDTEKSAWNGKQDALTFGISDTNVVKIDGDNVADSYYAKFTRNGLTGIDTNDILEDIGAASSSDVTQHWINIQRYGFVPSLTPSISFNDSSYVFTLTDTTNGWEYYRAGTLCFITGNKTVTLTPVDNTKYYIYINDTNGTLVASTSAWNLFDDNRVPVAVIFWNSTQTPKYLLSDERHTCLIDRRMHKYEHELEGTKLTPNTGTVDGYTLNSDVNTSKTISITEAKLIDEDLIITIPQLNDGNGIDPNYNIVYNSSGSWVWETSIVPFKYTTNGYIQYNNSSNVMTQAVANRYVNTYLVFCNIQGSLSKFFVTGAQHTTTAAAYGESIAFFSLTNFITNEGYFAYQFTWSTSASHTTLGKCTLNRVQKISSNITSTVVSSVAAHNTLSGLQGGGIINDYYHLSIPLHRSFYSLIETSVYVEAPNLVNIYDDNGTPKLRLADSSLGLPAHGMVDASYQIGALVPVYNKMFLALTYPLFTVGATYYLGNAGAITTTNPNTNGVLRQIIGVSPTTYSVQISISPSETISQVPTSTFIAGESLTAGNFINIYLNSGTMKVRKSNAASKIRADGFVLSNVSAGGSALIYRFGINNALSALTTGSKYFIGSSGAISTTPSSASNSIVQSVGIAISATELLFTAGNTIGVA